MINMLPKFMIVTTLFLAHPAPAAQSEPPGGFAPKQTIGNTELQQCGVATLKAYGLFTVGSSSLYRENCALTWLMPPDEPLYMEFRYYRDIPAEAFRESAKRILQRNVSLSAKEVGLLSDFHQAYQSVSEGDIYAITYARGKGLSLYLNGQLLATLNSTHLARSYFSIWLGHTPFDEEVKQQLLGQK